MGIEIITIDTADGSFEAVFESYKAAFLTVLSNSYPTYYGDEYQLKRIVEERSVLYLATVDNALVGVSYIKGNFRRGGTAVFPEQYRRKGIAERLVKESLNMFPRQYTILRADNHKMICLMKKLGFKRAVSSQEIERIVPAEFAQLSEFEFLEGCLVFKRRSLRRDTEREKLVFLHTF
jgi:GNAT superfamily N-acetyltransferase